MYNKTITNNEEENIEYDWGNGGVLSIAVFCLSACDNELDIQQAYPFTVETMPVQKHTTKGRRKRYAARSNGRDGLKRHATPSVISNSTAGGD